jgi:hypothetical protein
LQKEVILFISVLFFTSCSVSRLNSKGDIINDDIDSERIEIGNIEQQNLTSESFYIQKAEIKVLIKGERRNFIASVKFHKPDSFLISLRSNSGIEAARILLTSDSIIINDRINRTLLYGKKSDAVRKYGFSIHMVPLFLGDIIIREKERLESFECFQGSVNLDTYIDGFKINYSIGCNKQKSELTSIIRETDTKPIQLKFSDYIRLGDKYFARKVTMVNLNSFELVSIKFSKIEMNWHGVIEFIPGRNYEQVEIK